MIISRFCSAFVSCNSSLRPSTKSVYMNIYISLAVLRFAFSLYLYVHSLSVSPVSLFVVRLLTFQWVLIPNQLVVSNALNSLPRRSFHVEIVKPSGKIDITKINQSSEGQTRMRCEESEK